jgi:Uma2 family endonuclease
MNTVEEIKQAILHLSFTDRANIDTWIRETPYAWQGVAEPAANYAVEPESQGLSVEEYLQLEATSTIKHEYVAGEIFAMSGASETHNIIALNVASAFLGHLRGGPCRTFIADVKARLRIHRDEIFYYPDVMVACGQRNTKDHFVYDPRVIVEVLSPSTEAIDRREKAVNYKRIPSLEEYVLVAQDKPEVTLHRRSEKWTPEVVVAVEAVVEFRSIAFSLPLARIYDTAL